MHEDTPPVSVEHSQDARPVRPLVVAHRAGNDLRALAAAEAAGVDLIEADVWLHRGRLEVRHLKTLGPVPVLWDRWRLASARAPRLPLEEVVRACAPTTELMLDLKGSARLLPAAIVETMRRLAPGRSYTVATQSWQLLEPFAGLDEVRVVHSIGNMRKLRAMPDWLRTRSTDGLGINERLLSPERAEALLQLAPTLFTWTVNDRTRIDELVGWGVNGLICDDYSLLRPARDAS